MFTIYSYVDAVLFHSIEKKMQKSIKVLLNRLGRFNYTYLFTLLLIMGCADHLSANPSGETLGKDEKVPVVVITDLYHHYQDDDDNFDLIMGYALPEIDLRAIILDITKEFLEPVANHSTLWHDPRGPREAGIIPVNQLNYIFDKNIPFAVGPFSAMQSPKDKMFEIPNFQQAGVELLLETLRESEQKIEIISFGSARVISVAFNREPQLFYEKVKTIHLCAGTASPNFELGNDQAANAIPGGEWNVALDVHSFVRLLRSDLPVAIYPCAAKHGPHVLDQHNTFWRLTDLQFIRNMDEKLQRYLNYVFMKSLHHDFLRKMDIGNLPDSTTISNDYPSSFYVWTTAVWLQVSGRKLVERKGDYFIIAGRELKKEDKILSGELKYCHLPEVRDDGRFSFNVINEESNFLIYKRDNPVLNQKAFQEAVPKLYESFQIK